MPEATHMPLESELRRFRQLLPTLMDRVGEYAVIVNDELVGTFSCWEDACKAGYQHAGLDSPFLVKQIEETESVNYIDRELGACRTLPSTSKNSPGRS